MKNITLSISILIMLLVRPVISKEITEQSFEGQWCGQWDKIYAFCLTIQNIDSGALAQYRWLEHPDGKYKKSTKKIERVNYNTLKIDNIWFALDEKNSEQANAMGIFQYQTRIAVLSKQDLVQQLQ